MTIAEHVGQVMNDDSRFHTHSGSSSSSLGRAEVLKSDGASILLEGVRKHGLGWGKGKGRRHGDTPENIWSESCIFVRFR